MLSRCAAAIVVLISAPAAAVEVLPGPIPADVVRVIDGDTFVARLHVAPGLVLTSRIRLEAVDTPEMRGRCDNERQRAVAARDFAVAWLGQSVRLYRVRLGKYAGRLIAKVVNGAGQALSGALIAAGHGRAYAGGRRRPWC